MCTVESYCNIQLCVSLYIVKKMEKQEGSLIVQAQIEASTTTSKGNVPYPYLEEWVLWYPRSSNYRNASVDIFKDVYFLFRDVVVPNSNAYEMF